MRVGDGARREHVSNLELRIRQLEEIDERAAEEKDGRRVFILFDDEADPADEPLARDS